MCRAGTLPPEYANLTGLVDLDLHDNLLTGTLPAAYFTATAFTNNTFLEARCPLCSCACAAWGHMCFPCLAVCPLCSSTAYHVTQHRQVSLNKPRGQLLSVAPSCLPSAALCKPALSSLQRCTGRCA